MNTAKSKSVWKLEKKAIKAASTNKTKAHRVTQWGARDSCGACCDATAMKDVH